MEKVERPRNMTDEEKELFIFLYDKNFKIEEIAKFMKRDSATLWRLATKLGLTRDASMNKAVKEFYSTKKSDEEKEGILDQFFSNTYSTMLYWNGKEGSMLNKMDGLVFSLLVSLDGGSCGFDGSIEELEKSSQGYELHELYCEWKRKHNHDIS